MKTPTRCKSYGRALVCLLAAFSHACTTLSPASFATRDDYRASMAALREGDPGAALADFPTEEPGGFVTQVERGWLSLLAGKPDPTPLVQLGRDLEARKTFYVSKEAKAFFYVEAHDGYFPSEHEAVVLHLVTAMAFAAKGQKAEALIETRAASRYLQSEFSGKSAGTPFDDPALRLWLAALWTGLGEWESAKVDLRVAARLDPRWAGLAALAERPAPPAEFSLIFSGAGPDITWIPEIQANPLKGMQQLQFKTDFPPTAFLVAAPKTPLAQAQRITQAEPTAPWYDRHQERELAIKKIVEGSGYALRATGSAAAAGAAYTAGIVGGITLMTLGIGTGGAIIYYGLKGVAMAGVKSGEIVALPIFAGLAVAAVGIKGGVTLIKKSSAKGDDMLEKGVGQINSYRYVRFLPDFVSFATADAPLSSPVAVAVGDEKRALTPFLSLPGVHAFHYASHPKIRENTALLRTWTDQEQHVAFVLAAPSLTEPEAEMACGALAKTGIIGWRLPTWKELQDAHAHGAARRDVNPGFGPSWGRLTHVWTTDKGHNNHRADCSRVEMASLTEYQRIDCREKASVICARILEAKDQ